MAEANAEFDLELGSWPSLEAQVAAIADDIAYDNHDIDDGLRAGIIELDELVELPLVGAALGERSASAIPASARQAAAGAGPRHDRDDGRRRARRDRSGGSREAGVADDRRRARRRAVAGRLLGRARRRGAGAQALPLCAALRVCPSWCRCAIEAQRVVANLAAAYRADPALLPDAWRRDGDAIEQLRTIGDFIAGMTDRFAIARHEELVGPVEPARRPLLTA